jgi:phenylalanyl-tRNA synthetase alpha chain
MRLRPGYFPFVEPGFEIDAWHKVGKHEKRLEILGAGMLHPFVLKEAGIDPDEYSGFAFGMGMTRLVAIKNNISDIRVLTN